MLNQGPDRYFSELIGPGGLVVMLKALFDESETEGQMIVGGWIAEAEQWDKLGARWRSEILDPNGLDVVGYSDLTVGHKKPFKDWGVDRCLELRRRCLGIISDHVLHAIGVIVEFSDVDDAIGADASLGQLAELGLRSELAYRLGAIGALLGSSVWVHERYPGSDRQLLCVFEHGRKGIGAIAEVVQASNVVLNVVPSVLVPAPSKRQLVALQAADFFACASGRAHVDDYAMMNRLLKDSNGSAVIRRINAEAIPRWIKDMRAESNKDRISQILSDPRTREAP